MWFIDEQHAEGKRQTCFISANVIDEESLKSLKHTYTLIHSHSLPPPCISRNAFIHVYRLTHLSLFSRSNHCVNKMSSHMAASLNLWQRSESNTTIMHTVLHNILLLLFIYLWITRQYSMITMLVPSSYNYNILKTKITFFVTFIFWDYIFF